MTLTPADVALHRALGIDAELLDRQQVRRVDDHEAREVLTLNGRPGDLCGVLYPYLWPGSSRPCTHRLRRDQPEFENGQPKNKYLSAYGDRRHLYLACDDPAWLSDTTIPIIAMESEKAVLATTCAAARIHRQVLAIGLGGCWGWKGTIGKTTSANGARVDEKGPIADLDRITWPNRDAVLAFDANAVSNPKVRAARREFAKDLIKRGAKVRIAEVPEENGINGPDDFISTHGDEKFFALIDSAAAVNETSQDTALLPPPSNPMAVARSFVQEACTTEHGHVLHDHRGDFFRWDGRCWPENDKLDVRRDVYRYVEHAHYLDTSTKVPTVKPFAPTVRKVNDLIDALRACVGLPTSLEPPFWTESNGLPNAHEMIALQNGLLHLPTRTLYLHTPTFFGHHALAYPYLADAPTPSRWLAFLNQLWPGDATSIEALQEVFGYILGGETNLQKILLFVGPKRGGKGTIGRVLTGLLGKHNVAAPTLASVATNFGLSPLIGKPLALVSDARLSNKADGKIVVERLLSISGEDSLTIDRKYREPWTGRLPARFVVMTNELPRLSDASGALASRFIVFVLSKSFYGLENPKLTEELLEEAPSILSWALDGLDRLNQRGYFVAPKSGADAVKQLEDLSSPISAFVRDRCAVRHDASVDVETLWAAWKRWCEDENRHPGTKSVFFRDLHAAVPMIRPSKLREGDARRRVYVGITIKNTPDHPDHDGDDAPDGPGGPGGPVSSPMYPPQEDDGRF